MQNYREEFQKDWMADRQLKYPTIMKLTKMTLKLMCQAKFFRYEHLGHCESQSVILRYW